MKLHCDLLYVRDQSLVLKHLAAVCSCLNQSDLDAISAKLSDGRLEENDNWSVRGTWARRSRGVIFLSGIYDNGSLAV